MHISAQFSQFGDHLLGTLDLPLIAPPLLTPLELLNNFLDPGRLASVANEQSRDAATTDTNAAQAINFVHAAQLAIRSPRVDFTAFDSVSQAHKVNYARVVWIW